MRKVFPLIIVLAITFGLTVTTYATLIDRGRGLIYDTDLNIIWLQDAGMGGIKNWFDAMTWAANLVYGGYDDWRLPITPGLIPFTQVKARWDICITQS